MFAMNSMWWGSGKPPFPAYSTGVGIFGSKFDAMMKYAFTNNAVANGTALVSNTFDASGTSTPSLALFAGGQDSANTKIATSSVLTFASDSVSTGGNLRVSRALPNSVGNATIGYFAGGDIGTGGSFTGSTAVDIYTYSSNTSASGTALSLGINASATYGTATIGYFSGGQASSASPAWQGATQKYTYSNNSATTGTALSAVKSWCAGMSNTSLGIIAGGGNSTGALAVTEKYTFAGDVRTLGTNLMQPQWGGAAAGIASLGVVAGGGATVGNAAAKTSIYTYAGDTVVGGTNLPAAITSATGVSSTPGHF